MRRRTLLRGAVGLGTGLLAGLAGCGGEDGGSQPADTTTAAGGTPADATNGGDQTVSELSISSTAVGAGETLPERFTCDGVGVSPPVSASASDDATALALIVDDPDAPSGTFLHWALWNLPPDVGEIPEDVPATETVADLGGARQGRNDFGDVGYGPPCPPAGETHTYRFTLHALAGELGLSAGASPEDATDAVRDASAGTARLTAEYGR